MSDMVCAYDITSIDSIEVNLASPMSIALYNGGKADATAIIRSGREFESTSAELMQFATGPVSDTAREAQM